MFLFPSSSNHQLPPASSNFTQPHRRLPSYTRLHQHWQPAPIKALKLLICIYTSLTGTRCLSVILESTKLPQPLTPTKKPGHQLLLQTQLCCTSQRWYFFFFSFPFAQTLDGKLTRKTRRGALRNPAITSAWELATRASAAPASRQACVTLRSQGGKGGVGHVPPAPSPQRHQGRPQPPKWRERASVARSAPPPPPPGGLPAEGGRVSVTNVPRGNPAGLGAPAETGGGEGEGRAGGAELRRSPCPHGTGALAAVTRRRRWGERAPLPGWLPAAPRETAGKWDSSGPRAFPAEGGGAPAVLARLPRCSRESGAVRGSRPPGAALQPGRWGGSRRPRPALGCPGLRRFKRPSRLSGVVRASLLVRLRLAWRLGFPKRAARGKPRGASQALAGDAVKRGRQKALWKSKGRGGVCERGCVKANAARAGGAYLQANSCWFRCKEDLRYSCGRSGLASIQAMLPRLPFLQVKVKFFFIRGLLTELGFTHRS